MILNMVLLSFSLKPLSIYITVVVHIHDLVKRLLSFYATIFYTVTTL